MIDKLDQTVSDRNKAQRDSVRQSDETLAVNAKKLNH